MSQGFNGFLVVSSLGLFSMARDVVTKETRNGLYTPLQYVLATSLVQVHTSVQLLLLVAVDLSTA
jgi:hypothetical protein